METKEVYRTISKWDGGEVKDEQLRELLISHAKENTKDLVSKITATLEKLKEEFIKKEYRDDELIGEVVFQINAFKNSYFVEIKVYVYPKPHSDVKLQEEILSSRLFYYVSKDYTKSLNDIGTKIREKVSTAIQILELQEEVEKLKFKVKQLEEELEECQEEKEEEEDP